jgi:predicted  nucleic acid-binding Zn-ribbon protein
MVQLVCPLCGRFVSLRYFDPSSFENDVLGVDTVGLGRGRGTRVVAKFSLLDDSQLMRTIRDRCHLLVGIIDGKSPPDQKDLAALKGEVEMWRKTALDRHKEGNDLEAKIADMEGNLHYWQREGKRQERLNGLYVLKIADMEDSIRQWQGEARRLKKLIGDYESRIADDESIVKSWMNHSSKLSDEVSKLQSKNERLNRMLMNAQEEVGLAEELVDELLEVINSNANENFEDLSEAVEYLLEMG